MNELERWLAPLGLGHLAPVLLANDVDLEVLSELNEADLEKLGLSMGQRKKLLKAAESLPQASLAPIVAPAANQGATSFAERRQLTVMFCDMVGSTALATRIDPEDLREVIGIYQHCVVETASRFEGYVAKYMGDGVLVYFGWPQAHEDDAERAVRAALNLVEAVGQLGLVPDGLQVRIGIATGLVVVGDLIGTGESQERAVVGETPNLAARLQSVADPGGVVIADGTRRLLGSLFEYRDLGTLMLKGLAQPIRAWHVLAESRIKSRFEALRSRQTPLVGRKKEIELVIRRWEQAKSRKGRAVLVCGEPGVGKSRMLAAVEDRLRADPHTRLSYFCSPYHTNSALHPFITQLEQSAGITRDDLAPAKLAKLQALLSSSCASAEEVRLLAELLSLPSEPDPTSNPTPQQRKEKTLQALARQLQVVSATDPAFVVFEDAHWIDPTSQELLTLIIQSINDFPVLLVITCRPEFEPPWQDDALVTCIDLGRLDHHEGAVLAEHIGGDKKLPSEVVNQIIERTDGVPLFIEELTKTLIESGLLIEEAERYVLIGPLPPLAIPSTLQDSLMARLDRLSGVKEVAQIGAAIGREFPFGLVAELTDMHPAALVSALGQLEAAGLVFREGLVPEATYTFKHALVQDAAHEGLLRARRQALHARIGKLLEDRHPELAAVQPEVLARHFTEARLHTRAVTYWAQAGRKALARSAVTEALAHLRRGLDLLPDLPATPERTSLELDLRLALASASIATSGYAAEETEQAYVRAHDLLRQTGDTSRQFAVLYGLFVLRWNHSRLCDAVEIAAELLDRATRTGDPAPICVGHRALAVAYNAMAQFAEALDHASKSAALYDPEAHRGSAIQYGHDIGVAALMHQAVAQTFLGHADRSAVAAARGLSLAREVGHANTTGYSEMWSTFLSLIIRDIPAAIKSAEGLLSFAEERRMAFWHALARCMLGGALCAAGEARSGLELLDAGLADNEKARIRIFRPVFLCFRAEGLGKLGRSEEGLTATEAGLEAVKVSNESWWEAELLRQRAELRLSRNTVEAREQAERDLRAAVTISERQGSRYVQLRATMSLAQLWNERNKRAEARDLVASVYSWFSEEFIAPDLTAAKALLDELRE